jgi:quercetin dioxygenase-like cupin family protein
MYITKNLKYGKAEGTIYDFPEINDVLPMHAHTEFNNHITIICRGSFKAHGDGWEMIAKEGDVLDWQAGQNHELIALQPNSRFVNIFK